MSSLPAQDPRFVPAVGLCSVCVHAQRVPHPRGGVGYWRCAMAEIDPRFLKYPGLPVRACDGFVHYIAANKTPPPGKPGGDVEGKV
ncbi:MAG: hypothetical protein WD873_01790 [Candidatus Hydrogenedentales bacterium]